LKYVLDTNILVAALNGDPAVIARLNEVEPFDGTGNAYVTGHTFQVSTDGEGRVTVVNDSGAAVDVLLDLNGYFQ
jgi:predicted nucleic acid-binding protein